MDQGPCCSQRSTVWGVVCRAYNGDTSFSELDAGEGPITTTTTVAEYSSGLDCTQLVASLEKLYYPYSSG